MLGWGGQIRVRAVKSLFSFFYKRRVKLRSDSLTLFSNAEAKDCVDIEP